MIAPTFNDVAEITTEQVEAFLKSAREGDIGALKKALAETPHIVNKQDFMGDTALIEAVRNKKFDAAKLLLEAKANPDTPNNVPLHPLILATLDNNVRMVELLLKHKANPDVKSDFDTTPLMLAATEGYAEIAQMLVNAKASLEIRDGFGKTAFSYSVTKLDEKMVRLLKAAGADINARDDFGESGINYTASNPLKVKMFDLLIELGADFVSGTTKPKPGETGTGAAASAAATAAGTTPAMQAAFTNNIYVLQKLKDLGAPVDAVNVEGLSPLYFAAAGGATGAAELLIGWNVPVDTDPSPRDIAFRNGHHAIVTLIDQVNGRRVVNAVSNHQHGNGQGVIAPSKASFKKKPRLQP